MHTQSIACIGCGRGIDKGRFCSPQCYQAWRRRDRVDTAVCPICSQVFRPKDRRQRFCSTPCYRTWWAANVQPKATAGRVATLTHGADGKIAAVPKAMVAPAPDAVVHRDPAGTPVRMSFHFDKEEAAERRTHWAAFEYGEAVTLTGYGAGVTVEQDRLVLHGDGVDRVVYRGQRTLRTLVILARTGTLSLAAIQWCQDQDVSVLTLDRDGALCGLVEPSGKYSTLRRRQWSIDPLPLARALIARKLTACETVRPRAAVILRQFRRELPLAPSVDAVRLLEARAALVYWASWQMDIRWDGRRPVPDGWQVFEQRAEGGSARHARHPVNAMLNYGYAVLAGRLQRAIITRGLDPMAGFLHADKDGRASLVYDLIEPLRAPLDAVLLGWVARQTFSRGDVIVDTSGVVTLKPELARVIVGLADEAVPDRAYAEMVGWYVERLRTISAGDDRGAST